MSVATDHSHPRLLDTAEEAAFRKRLRDWLETNKVSASRSDLDARRRWQKKLFDAGWIGLSWPAEYGGQGATLRQEFIYNEEVARAGVPEPLTRSACSSRDRP